MFLYLASDKRTRVIADFGGFFVLYVVVFLNRKLADGRTKLI